MNFTEIVKNRQSCRSFDSKRLVENKKIDAILDSARLSPSTMTLLSLCFFLGNSESSLTFT